MNSKLWNQLALPSWLQLLCQQQVSVHKSVLKAVLSKFLTLHSFTFSFAVSQFNHLAITLIFVLSAVLSFPESIVRFNFPGKKFFRRAEPPVQLCKMLFTRASELCMTFQWVYSNFGDFHILFLSVRIGQGQWQCLLIVSWWVNFFQIRWEVHR